MKYVLQKAGNISLISVRICLGVLFAFSGIIKIFNLVLFQETIEMFNILPQYSKTFTILIPAAETVAGIFLLFGIYKKVSSFILCALTAGFSAAVLINLLNGHIFDCGCFGPLKLFSDISWGKIAFNMILISGLLLVFIKDKAVTDFFDQSKVVLTLTFLAGFLIYTPFSNTTWAYVVHIKNIEDIDWQKAEMIVKNGNGILFDARTKDLYENEHVPAALFLPVIEFADYYSKYNIDDKNTPLIIYCSAADCASAKRVGFKLIARGYRNIFTISGGFEEWEKMQSSL